MKLSELLARTSLKSAGRRVGLDVQMTGGQLTCSPLDSADPRYCSDFVLPSMKMVEACRADAFDIFLPWIEAGMLTEEQMRHAAARYHLGKTRSGQPMFWMIDDMLSPQDAHIGSDSSGCWLSALLKNREPMLLYWCPTHCLFGLNLMYDGRGTIGDGRGLPPAIAIVESEASAVVLSELFPETIWMAYATVSHLCVDLFSPLEGRTVTIYPRTDPYMCNYLYFEELAANVRRHLNINISVDTTLEDYATDEQKKRCIDLLDFLLEDCRRDLKLRRIMRANPSN